MRATGAQPFDHLEQVGEGPGETVGPHHDQRVAAADPVEAAREFDPPPAAAGGALLEDHVTGA